MHDNNVAAGGFCDYAVILRLIDTKLDLNTFPWQ